jgi:hypothetical protein
MNDEELFEALKLNQNDSVNLWKDIHSEVKARVSFWEFLTPLATAAAALLVIQGLTHRKVEPASSWPVHELVVPATITLQGQ